MPAAVLLDFDPGSEARLALLEFDLFLLASPLVAASSGVGGNLYLFQSASGFYTFENCGSKIVHSLANMIFLGNGDVGAYRPVKTKPRNWGTRTRAPQTRR